jgi:hypothetical protein
MAEYMGKVTAVEANETIEVSLFSGGFVTKNDKPADSGPGHYRSLRRNRNGDHIRRMSGQKVWFFWKDIRNGPVRVGSTVMVEMQPVSRPVRMIKY